ncbi:hypothetical protein BXY58_1369 [Epilithonimonas arachidiradicis]|uniref:Uncharacterized protein n=1 Tax=Epilithonimonas arachidiradicis TaxID=1617282 RepID=A0A420DAR1_9FLAO|nr:hypothetical protein BXY58_1369 [Epilithonimonas arachidiradicis]
MDVLIKNSINNQIFKTIIYENKITHFGTIHYFQKCLFGQIKLNQQFALQQPTNTTIN